MFKTLSYIITPSSVTVNNEGCLKIFTSDKPEYEKIKEFVRNDDEKGIIDLLNSLKQTVEGAYGKVGFRVVDDVVFVGETALPRTLGQRIKEFAQDKLPHQPLLRLWERLNQNPSFRALHNLYECLEHNHHPILPDGRFLAWKRVTDDFKDFFTGKFDNSVGAKPEMPRNLVDEDPNKTCSDGLHVASFDYVKNHYYGGKGQLIEVAVDPKDIVAIPSDYNHQKMRVTTYEVLRVCTEEDKRNLIEDDVTDDICEDCGENIDGCTCDDCPECGQLDCVCDDDDEEEFCSDCGEVMEGCTCDEDEDEDDDFCPKCTHYIEDCTCDTNPSSK